YFASQRWNSSCRGKGRSKSQIRSSLTSRRYVSFFFLRVALGELFALLGVVPLALGARQIKDDARCAAFGACRRHCRRPPEAILEQLLPNARLDAVAFGAFAVQEPAGHLHRILLRKDRLRQRASVVFGTSSTL